MYKSVDDVDLFVGVLGEWVIKGGIVGPVTSSIIAYQCARLINGDRFSTRMENNLILSLQVLKLP